MHRYLHGQSGVRDVRVVDEQRGLLAYGKEIVVLREARDPAAIPWREHGVALVVECTGRFVDPHAEADAAEGALRGHLTAGARAVVVSSPFKSKQKEAPLPDDATILMSGINDWQFDPADTASYRPPRARTTALAHMMRPLLERDLTRNMLTAGMTPCTPRPTRNRCSTRYPAPAPKIAQTRGRPRQRRAHLDQPPPPLSSRSCPRSPVSASWPTRCRASPRRP